MKNRKQRLSVRAPMLSFRQSRATKDL